jgi:hypothetical protein
MNLKQMLFVSFVGLMLMAGCASSLVALSAPQARFPVSMTEGFYDNDYNLVAKERYDVVHHFVMTYRYATASSLSATKRIDLSDTLASMMKTYGGDAVVNVSFAENCSEGHKTLRNLGFITGLVTLGLVAPSEVQATVEGDVVRLRAQGGSQGGGP